MTGNRVEELEAKVRELEATVDGLVDELVETKDRLRSLENRAGTDVDGIIEGRPSRAEARETVDASRVERARQPGEAAAGGQREQGQRNQQQGRAEGQPAAGASQPGTQEAVDEAVDGTDADGDAAADGGKSDETQAGEEDAEQSDDIIVA